MDDLEPLATEIRNADTAAVLTGAGISAPSGVPTLRGDDGVWDAFDEGQFTYGRFKRDPAGFWEDRVELYRTMFAEGYEPNAAHDALAELTQERVLDSVLTQNTDGLHAKAAAQVETVNGTDQIEIGADEFASHESILELPGTRDESAVPTAGLGRPATRSSSVPKMVNSRLDASAAGSTNRT